MKDNKRGQEWSVKVEEVESAASTFCFFFPTPFLPNTRRCGHLSNTLFSRAKMSSRNITVEDEKSDCGLIFFLLARVCSLTEVRNPLCLICHFVSTGSRVRTDSVERVGMFRCNNEGLYRNKYYNYCNTFVEQLE